MCAAFHLYLSTDTHGPQHPPLSFNLWLVSIHLSSADCISEKILFWLTPVAVNCQDRQARLSAQQNHCSTNILFLDQPECIRLSNLDRSLKLWLLITEPHHPDDGHGDAEPVKEAEEVYDGEDVVGEGIEQRHETLWERNRIRCALDVWQSVLFSWYNTDHSFIFNVKGSSPLGRFNIN